MVSGSEYVNSARREYSLYVLSQRAIPAITDGLKPAARRVLWTARGKGKIKSATLAGATMPIHPHASPEGTINTLAAPYGNNYPLLQGYGAFGTLLVPDAYGASRYTSVAISEFGKKVLFKDIEIIPLKDNYDSTTKEPVHFLPLIPIAIINPVEGIAVGYSTTIAPRLLVDVIERQLAHLNKEEVKPTVPTFLPTKNRAYRYDGKWVFQGEIHRENTTVVTITKLPFGTNHGKIVANEKSKLNKLLEAGKIVDYEDNSKDVINIQVKFKRGVLASKTDSEVLNMFGLVVNVSENLNVLNFNHNSIMETSDVEIIEKFTDWRLDWYVQRYERLKGMIEKDIQKYLDILLAIKKDAGKIAGTKKNKAEYENWLRTIGVVNDQYISGLPTYRYTEEERIKVENMLVSANKQRKEYITILGSKVKRRNIYKNELEEICTMFKRGPK